MPTLREFMGRDSFEIKFYTEDAVASETFKVVSLGMKASISFIIEGVDACPSLSFV